MEWLRIKECVYVSNAVCLFVLSNVGEPHNFIVQYWTISFHHRNYSSSFYYLLYMNEKENKQLP